MFSPVAILLAWCAWVAGRGWLDFWLFLARVVARTTTGPRLVGGGGFTLPRRWRALVAVSVLGRWLAEWSSRLVNRCPICFWREACPYHWTARHPDHGRVLPSRRQKQAARRAP